MLRKLFFILCLLVLAACGGGGDGDSEAQDAPDTEDTQQQNDTDDETRGDVYFTVEGDLDAAVEVQDAGWGLPSEASQPFDLGLFEEVGTNMISLQNIPLELSEGMTIDIVDSGSFSDPSGTYAMSMTASDVYTLTGTITITGVSDTFSGTFELEGLHNSDDSRTISISGGFQNVPIPDEPSD